MCFYMFSGMFISLLIYFVIPTVQSIYTCQLIINLIYTVDTPTNVYLSQLTCLQQHYDVHITI